jgi:hypothetical protein
MNSEPHTSAKLRIHPPEVEMIQGGASDRVHLRRTDEHEILGMGWWSREAPVDWGKRLNIDDAEPVAILRTFVRGTSVCCLFLFLFRGLNLGDRRAAVEDLRKNTFRDSAGIIRPGRPA